MSIRNPNQNISETRQRHIEELKEQITRITGCLDNTYVSPSCPDDIAEKFLENVLAFEKIEEKPLFDVLVESGVTLPAPGNLSDGQLGEKLWEVIRAMSALGHYLYHTGHLSDRMLYERLWHETLRTPTTIIPADPDFACNIDLVGSGSEEDIGLYLKYYADEEARQDWAEDWPDDTLPAHEDPPYDRDALLPSPPFF